MEYVVGSVAALVSGNVTPSRPKHLRKALTPTKHQPSPNVTPKSEFVDRSIFLSPTLQKKKAIVKKSPKRIFENPDLDVTDDNSSLISPKADKVKKHLRIELEADTSANTSLLSPESPKDNSEMLNRTPKKNKKSIINNIEAENENTPTKNKKRKSSENGMTVESIDIVPSPKKKQKQMKHLSQNSDNLISKNVKSGDKPVEEVVKSPKKQNKKHKSVAVEAKDTNQSNSPNKQSKKNILKHQAAVVDNTTVSPKKQKKRNKGKKNKNQSKVVNESKPVPTESVAEPEEDSSDDENEDHVNPNAITNEDTDSDHESDDDVESENDEANKKALEPEESSDEKEEKEEVKKEKPEEKKHEALTEDEIKRTIFVGNVPFNKKCKKEIKKIFSEFGTIETVRIRTVPVKDATMTPKMAVIKRELHPDRSTVNVYVKFADLASAEKALSANNTVLNEHHLRVTRSDTTGAPHDPKCAVFVGNIPFALEDETLRAKFEKCGEIDSVRIVRDRKTNAGKGFGYVNFASKDGVELALALSEEDLTIKNRILRVKRCTQTESKNKAKPARHFLAGKNQGARKFPPGQKNENTGASRRIAKRKKEEKGDGPPNKRPRDINQPKEKKARKEFVGMTAEKKKKNKFNKGQKKKKAISEILTKK